MLSARQGIVKRIPDIPYTGEGSIVRRGSRAKEDGPYHHMNSMGEPIYQPKIAGRRCPSCGIITKWSPQPLKPRHAVDETTRFTVQWGRHAMPPYGSGFLS